MPASGIRFGTYELDPVGRELRHAGVRVRLHPQQFMALESLVRGSGRVVTREEIRARLWPADAHIDFDRSINRLIAGIRDLLSDSAENPRFIETIPRVGFRFLVPVDDRVRSVAVLPLVNLSGEPEREYFSDGLTEELIASLSRLDGLRVIAHSSVQRYKRSAKPLAEIAGELGTDALLDGSVIRSGDRTRISARLMLVRDQVQVWSESFDRNARDVFDLVSEVAEAVARGVGRFAPGPAQKDRWAAAATPLDAYHAYLRGRHFLSRRTPHDLAHSLDHFESALRIDASYARSWAGLAHTCVVLGLMGLRPPHEVFPRAKAAAERALSLNSDLAEAHTLLAEVQKDYEWNWVAAERGYVRALSLDPNYAVAHQFYAQLLAMLGRYPEAVDRMEAARRCDPVSAEMHASFAFVLNQSRQFEGAVAEADAAIDLDPTGTVAYWYKGQAHQGLGEQGKAIQALEAAVRLPGCLPVIYGQLGHAYARAGDIPRAQGVLSALRERQAGEYITPMAFAMVQLGLKRHSDALASLEEAYRTRTFRVLAINGPVFSELAGDRRYESLLRRLRLPQGGGRSRLPVREGSLV
jgi:TolB-like protein/Tfp pilus assembly protein PilF